MAIKSALNVCCCFGALFFASLASRTVADGFDVDYLRALLARAAMIVPRLAGIRSTFAEASQRNMALGLWAAVGSGSHGWPRWWAACC